MRTTLVLLIQSSTIVLAAISSPLYTPSALVVSLASQNSLNHIIYFPSPSTPLTSSGTLSYLQSNYQLNNNKVSGGNISESSYVFDPFVTSKLGLTEPTVLAVNYPRGSYSGNALGGLQFYSEVLDGYQTVMLSYQVGFSVGFNFNKGGKLPGLFGGSDFSQCSGGKDSPVCFSARLMFRTGGAGEVYAYIPVYPGFCDDTKLDCNSEYGTSISRGSFTFIPGTWNNVTMIISLNTPGKNNGLLQFYTNGVQVMNYSNIVWRTDPKVTFSALMFSTFFGGSDSSWASTGGTSYFRGFDLYGSYFASNTTGQNVTATYQPGLAGTAATSTSNSSPSKASTSGTEILSPIRAFTSIPIFIVSLICLV